MVRLLLAGTNGPNDPTRATLPFLSVKAAKESGMDAAVFLLNDGVMVAKRGVADFIMGVGLPPLKDLLKFAIDSNVQIFVCSPCAAARGVTQVDLIPNASFADAKKFVSLCAEASNVVTF